MVCRDWQRKIPVFLDNKMPMKEQEKFISHVRGCTDCYEELEIMYMLAEGLQELENGTDDSFNFKRMLDRKLKAAQFQCERYCSFLKIKGLILGIMYGVTIIGIAIQIWIWI